MITALALSRFPPEFTVTLLKYQSLLSPSKSAPYSQSIPHFPACLLTEPSPLWIQHCSILPWGLNFNFAGLEEHSRGCREENSLNKLKTQVSVAKRCFKTVSKPPKADFRQLRPKFQGVSSHRNWRFTMKMHHFKTVILSDWRIILQNARRFLFLTGQRTITYLSFPTSVAYWENQINL